MNESDETIGDDGLTDQERDFLRTPVVKVPPEHRPMLIAIREKKDNFVYAENERLRRAEEHVRDERFSRGVE